MKKLTSIQKKEIIESTLLRILTIGGYKNVFQLYVRDFDIRHIFKALDQDKLESIYGVKKGSSEYDQAAYDLTSEFQVKDRSRIIQIDLKSKKLALEIEELREKYFKGNLSLKNEIMEKAFEYNELIEEFTELNKPIAKFVRLHNKIARQVIKQATE